MKKSKVIILLLLPIFIVNIHEIFRNVYFDVGFPFSSEVIDIQWYIYDICLRIVNSLLFYIVFLVIKDISYKHWWVSFWMMIASLTEIPEYILYFNANESFWWIVVFSILIADIILGAYIHRVVAWILRHIKDYSILLFNWLFKK